jgi:hypothetical protein
MVSVHVTDVLKLVQLKTSTFREQARNQHETDTKHSHASFLFSLFNPGGGMFL